MSEEETIKRIEKTLKLTELCQRTTNAPKLSENYIWDMRTLLDLYNKEKRKNIQLLNSKIGVDLSFADYISKDKIREKIKELEENNLEIDFAWDSGDVINAKYEDRAKLDILKELLEA